MNTEILRARENLLEVIQAFLKKYDHIPHREKSMALLLAEERFLKVKQALEEGQNQSDNVQELLLKLLNVLKILNKMKFLSDEDVLFERKISKFIRNPLFDEEIISTKIDPQHFNDESDLIESLLNKDTVITSPKIDFLLEEFAELNSEISDAMIESFSSSPIPVKDSDSLMEEIDIFLAADDLIPSGIDSDGFDSEHGSDLVVSFPSRNRNKTFDPGISIEVQSKIFLSLNKFSISFISDPLSPVLETLLLFSSEFVDKVFKPGILVLKEDKSPHLLSHRGFKAFKIIHNFLNESPMMIYGGDMPILDVPYLQLLFLLDHFKYGGSSRLKIGLKKPKCSGMATDSPDYEDSRARGFVQCSLDLHPFACLFWVPIS
ncbi:hypothetical protein Tco_0098595 [Tanacetum coccineum]